MSRSGYDDGYDTWAMIRWRGAVMAAIRGARGQALLRDLAAALDAMPDKRLAADVFVADDGCMCALGVLGAARGYDLASLNQNDPDVFDGEVVALTFGVAKALVLEIMNENDDDTFVNEWRTVSYEIEGPLRPWESRIKHRRVRDVTAPAHLWRHMREWVRRHINSTGEISP
jgi:hypothetical protein